MAKSCGSLPTNNIIKLIVSDNNSSCEFYEVEISCESNSLIYIEYQGNTAYYSSFDRNKITFDDDNFTCLINSNCKKTMQIIFTEIGYSKFKSSLQKTCRND